MAILVVALSCIPAWFGCTLCILVNFCHTSRMTLKGNVVLVARICKCNLCQDLLDSKLQLLGT